MIRKQSIKKLGLLNLLKKLHKENQTRIFILGLDKHGKTTIQKGDCSEELFFIRPESLQINELLNEGPARHQEHHVIRNMSTDGMVFVISKNPDEQEENRFESLITDLAYKHVPILVLINQLEMRFILDADEVFYQMQQIEFELKDWNEQTFQQFSKEGNKDGIKWLHNIIDGYNDNT